jgi:transcriptional regulator with GAF, ATPase, and Fis domain/pSer/pThr/pTyr-binding forkhead associated (FHA) protein
MFELRVEGSEAGSGVVSGEGTLTLGRAWTNDLALLNSPQVSGHHGEASEKEGKLWYRDLGSRNGSSLLRPDGTQLVCTPGGKAVEIQVGDILLLGSADAPARVRIGRPTTSTSPQARLLTTLGAERPLLDLVQLARSPSWGLPFVRFVVGLLGEMSVGQVVDLLAGAVLELFPPVQSLSIHLQEEGAVLTRDRGAPGSDATSPTVAPRLLRRLRGGREAIVFETAGRAGFGAPLCSGDEVLGVLLAWHGAGVAPPTEEALRLVQTFAHHAGRVLREAETRSADRATIERLEQQVHGLQEQLKDLDPELEVIGNDPDFLAALARARQVARFPTPVLITGPTGTGKELFARAVHRFSDRSGEPFIAINCGALPRELLEAELFGHAKGAFTGADKERAGLFETADGGTLFLDEVGEIPTDLQVKLLRVLQEGELFRLGSSTPIRVDVRVVSATHRDLAADVREGSFREDLLYRLNVFPIQLPALADRPGDIPLLATHFVSRLALRFGRESVELGPSAIERLIAEPWPGNVRELRNRIERSLILCEGSTIEAEHVAPVGPGAQVPAGFPQLAEAKTRFVRAHVQQALALSDGVQRDAAKLLGVDPSNLSRLLRDLGLR